LGFFLGVCFSAQLTFLIAQTNSLIAEGRYLLQAIHWIKATATYLHHKILTLKSQPVF
jgi:hypothetical protein